ncbi:unnamed protein product [Protopolystoma xenopodis]|uniref:Uncharacterized protein n=1 Tax=Protopolystoma xenopodis TaxID=117903 RepID=A0A448WF73_9PLAT|nr:unnamed protein product [Protopolystoma xenopodis]
MSLQLSRDEMQLQCLPVDRLMGEMHVSPDAAFALHRSLFDTRLMMFVKID